MGEPITVSQHYSSGTLLARIEEGFAKLGKTPTQLTLDDLGLVDEFHIGGRRASQEFFPQLGLGEGDEVLDIGSGIGGPARFAAASFGCHVTGLDLTPEFVETGRTLTRWLAMDKQVDLHQGSALDMPFEDHQFDAAYMLHVGMNIADKETLIAQASRVLKPKAGFGIYDVMRSGEGELVYPVPWASVCEISAVDPPARYKKALEANGFEIIAERSRKDFALAFFAEMKARAEAAGSDHPLGPQIVMGRIAPEKIANMLANINAGKIAPVELIARRA